MITWPETVDGIRLLELLGVWAAAIATFGAAYTALKISREQYKVHVLPSLETGYLLPSGAANIPVIELSATNTGFWDASITGFQLSHALLKGRIFITDFNWKAGQQLPYRLPAAETRPFFAGYDVPHDKWIEDIADVLFKDRNLASRWVIYWTLRVLVQVGNGRTYGSRPGIQFLTLLKKRVIGKAIAI